MKVTKYSTLVVMVLMAMVLAACGPDATSTAVPPTNTVPAAVAPTNTAMMAAPTEVMAAPTATTMMAAATNTAGMMGETPTAGSGGMTTMQPVKGALTIWHSYGSGGSAEGDALTKALAQFAKDNPDAKLTVLDVPFDQLFNKFETEAASGGGPDLFIAPNDSLGKEARANLLLDLTPMMGAMDAMLKDNLQVAIDGSKVDGKLYAVPESLKAVAMFYNKDKVKTVPATTDELMTAVKGGLKFGINQSAYHNWGFYSAFGGTIFDEKGACVAGTNGVVAAYQYLKDLKAAGAQFFTDGNKFDEAFQNGELDAIIEGPWKTGDFKKALSAKLGVAAIPAGPKGPAKPMTGVDGWYINANATGDKATQAVNFAMYMVSPKIEQIFVADAGHIPANKTIQIADPITQGFAKAVADGYPRPQIKELDNYWGNFGDTLNKIMDAGADPAAAVTAACAATDKANGIVGGGMMGETPTAGSGGMTTMQPVKGALTIWHSYGSGGSAEGDALTKALAQFAKDNPDAKLTVLDVPFDQLFNKFETEAASGGGPDLFIAPNDSLGKEARANLLLDLTPMMGAMDAMMKDNLQVAIDGSKVDGKLYAVPESLKAVAMFYNKDKVKTVPATTDELMTAVKGGLKFGINQSAYHNWGFYSAFGGTIFDEKGACVAGTNGVVAAYQYLKDLKAAGVQFFTDGNKFDEAFQNGELDAIIEGPWKTGDFKKALSDKLGVAAIPAGPKGPAKPMTGVDGWYINANATGDKATQAVNFALYMVSPKIEQIFVADAGHIPANKTIQIADPITQGFAKAVADGYPRPQIKELDNYWGNFGDTLNKIMDAGADPAEAVTAACAATDKANGR